MTDTKPSEGAKPAPAPTKPATADEVKDAALDVAKPTPAGVDHGAVLTLRQRKDREMQDPTSALRNQDTVENIVDHQLLTNAPAVTIQAMTGWTLKQLEARAKELETTLKGSLAGDFRPPTE